VLFRASEMLRNPDGNHPIRSIDAGKNMMMMMMFLAYVRILIDWSKSDLAEFLKYFAIRWTFITALFFERVKFNHGCRAHRRLLCCHASIHTIIIIHTRHYCGGLVETADGKQCRPRGGNAVHSVLSNKVWHLGRS